MLRGSFSLLALCCSILLILHHRLHGVAAQATDELQRDEQLSSQTQTHHQPGFVTDEDDEWVDPSEVQRQQQKVAAATISNPLTRVQDAPLKANDNKEESSQQPQQELPLKQPKPKSSQSSPLIVSKRPWQWQDFWVEAILAVVLALYLYYYKEGKNYNQKLASQWHAIVRDLYLSQFSFNGTAKPDDKNHNEDDDDNETMAAASETVNSELSKNDVGSRNLINNGNAEWLWYGSGRTGMKRFIARLQLAKRFDLFHRLWSFYSLVSSSSLSSSSSTTGLDQLNVYVELDDGATQEDYHFIASIVPRTRIKNLMSTRYDLGLTKYVQHPDLHPSLCLNADNERQAMEIFGNANRPNRPALLKVINDYAQYINEITISDQPAAEPEKTGQINKHINISINIPGGSGGTGDLADACDAIAKQAPLYELPFVLVDVLESASRLTADEVKKAMQARHAQESTLRKEEQKRIVDAARERKLAKDKEAKQAAARLGGKYEDKWEAKQQKKQMKKRMSAGKVRVMK